MTIIRYYIMLLYHDINHEYHFDKSFVPHQLDLVGIIKFENVFPGSCYNEFLNSLYVTLENLEIYFSLSWILGSYEIS